ncbi:562_t:CDS:10, partial [Funneliformis caledonium]
MIIAFVIDVCEDETLVGSSLLDIVKDGIRNFLEYMNGTRDQYRTKYLLVSSDKEGYCIKWEYKKDGNKLYKLFEQLELLQPDPLFYGSGLETVFEYLNFRRICRWHDFFCRGNYIEHNETSCIFWFTDGKNLNWLNNGLVYSKDSEKSTNIYQEKYRWEQRLYTFYLSKSDSSDFPRQLDWINMKMLGQLYKIQTFEQMVHAFDNIICIKDPYPLSKLRHMRPLKKTCGVHLNLVELEDGSPERNNHFVHLYVDPNKINGTYPIPEEYWVEPDAMRGFSPKFVYEHKRPSIPTIIFWKTNKLSADVYDLPPQFSRDIYKLSDCDVSKELLRQKPGTKWPVYVEHSGRHSQGVLGQPFGYLTAIRKDEYTIEAYNIQNYAEPSMDWRKAMEGYLYNIPWYYYSILASTLKQYYGIYSNIFPILNMERYDSWCKQLTKEADAKFNQMIEKNISNRLNLFKPLLLPKK